VQTDCNENSPLITGPKVQARYQKSYVTIWRWINSENYGGLAFPKPLQINGLNYWRLSELEAWEAAQAEKPYTPRASKPPKRKAATGSSSATA
jgi:predicted DNA-binding transcriptional regulator AlpA